MTHSKRAAILWPALALLAGLWLTAGASPPVARAAGAAQEEARRTIVLDVDGMTCDMCPITVRKALEKVPGVTEVEAKYEGDGRGWARVTFDPRRTTVEELTKATASAGYPSRPRADGGEGG